MSSALTGGFLTTGPQGSLCFIHSCQVVLVVKIPPANPRDIRNVGLIPGSDRSPGGGHGSPLQYSCLENPMDRGVWQAIVHVVAKESDMTEATEHACKE